MSKRTDALFPLLKEKYEHELQRRRYFDNVVTLPITLIAFLAAGIFVVITDTARPQWFEYAGNSLVILILGCICFSFWYLFRMYFNGSKRYSSFPESEEIRDRYNLLENNHTSGNGRAASIKAQFNKDIEEWYVASNTNNTKINDERGEMFSKLSKSISLAYGLGLVLFIFLWIAKSNMPQKEEKPALPQGKTVNIQTTVLQPEPTIKKPRRRRTPIRECNCPTNQTTIGENCKEHDQQRKKEFQGDTASKN